MTLIASHRGGTHLWPENSLLAFRETAKLPVDYVEFDVHQTADGALVVHHDATLDRTTDGKGPIGALTLAEMRRHVVIGAGGEPVPTLDEVIAIFQPTTIDLRLELKPGPGHVPYAGMAEKIAARLVETDMLTRTLATSFRLESLAEFRAAVTAAGSDPARLRGLMWLVGDPVVTLTGWDGVAAAAAAYGITEVGPKAAFLDAAAVAKLRGHGLTVHAYGAHTQAAATAMFDLGIASFTSDRPDLALAAKARRS
jgi:glycerophosphoryl diester phosphodiesterase